MKMKRFIYSVSFLSILLLLMSFSHRTDNIETTVVDSSKELSKIDDRYLKLFSEEIQLDSTKGYYTGSPSAVVYRGVIYIFYSYHTQHQAVLGQEQDYRYYRFSKDGGMHWSERKKLKFPSSNIPGISFCYGGQEFVNAGNKIMCLGVLIPSDTCGMKPYRAYYCQLKAKRNGELKYRRFTMLPYVNEDGSKVDSPAIIGDYSYVSNILAGNVLLLDGALYWCYYNSARNVQLIRWDTKRGKSPTKETIDVLANIGDYNKKYSYSEVGMFYENGNIILSIRDENANNSNWKYEIATCKLSHIANTETKAFGPNIYKPMNGPALLTGRQYTYLKSREQLTRMDNLILLSPEGEIIKENIGFVGHPMGGDSMYCSTVEHDGTIFIFYYYGMNSSQVSPNSHYTLAYKTIKVEDLQKLLD